MSNLRLNIRLFYWHLQIGNNWKIELRYNDWHKGLPQGWFEVYTFRLFKR